MDVTDTYGEERPSMDTPHARWIKLQMAYITAVGFIVDLSRLGAHLPGPIELVIHTIPPARGIMAPLMPVIENIMNRYGLCLHAEGPDGNVLTDMEIIKTAFEDLRECTDPSLGRSLDLMCQGEFSGQVHCEAALAALMFDPASGFQTRDKEVMGVSRRCCPVCSAVLDALPFYEGRPIDVLGHHTAAIPCALPDNLPPSAINFVLGCFEREFVLSLHGLCVLSKRSRAKSKSGFGYEARNDVLRQRVAYAQGKLA
ncbi:hypothetical protein BD779DRAFT_1673305 [Infundibulicybe gibba]|nr:hypothetical protein BD779DRAFT_1673305 [Infundibulicybe gibba]